MRFALILGVIPGLTNGEAVENFFELLFFKKCHIFRNSKPGLIVKLHHCYY